jgi:hypothetical protein
LKILTITFLCQQFTLFNVLTGFEVVIWKSTKFHFQEL